MGVKEKEEKENGFITSQIYICSITVMRGRIQMIIHHHAKHV
jgi:hypothetical protein